MHLFETIKANEQGVADDLNPEFLHDFRVAARRGRSVVRELRSLVPETITRKLLADLKSIGKASNHLRDLDVCLMAENEYRNQLPATHQIGLDLYFCKINEERKNTLQSVQQFIRSDEYKTMMNFWAAYLRDDASWNELTPESTFSRAQRTIYKRFKKVCKTGKAITDGSPDIEFHHLRISCKQLRYLLEMFRSLFPKEIMTSLIKNLKQLQDLLGAFNDLSFQHNMVITELNTLNPNDLKTQQLSNTLNCLTAHINMNKMTIRSAFSDTFVKWHCKKNINTYKSLFKTPSVKTI